MKQKKLWKLKFYWTQYWNSERYEIRSWLSQWIKQFGPSSRITICEQCFLSAEMMKSNVVSWQLVKYAKSRPIETVQPQSNSFTYRDSWVFGMQLTLGWSNNNWEISEPIWKLTNTTLYVFTDLFLCRGWRCQEDHTSHGKTHRIRRASQIIRRTSWSYRSYSAVRLSNLFQEFQQNDGRKEILLHRSCKWESSSWSCSTTSGGPDRTDQNTWRTQVRSQIILHISCVVVGFCSHQEMKNMLQNQQR